MNPSTTTESASRESPLADDAPEIDAAVVTPPPEAPEPAVRDHRAKQSAAHRWLAKRVVIGSVLTVAALAAVAALWYRPSDRQGVRRLYVATDQLRSRAKITCQSGVGRMNVGNVYDWHAGRSLNCQMDAGEV
jgi:hypothetical protein